MESKPTKSVQIVTDNVVIDGFRIKAQIWDSTGDQAFSSIKKSFLKDANVAIIVCDVSRKQSFKRLDKWYNYVKAYAGPKTVTIVIGNKADLKHLREIQYTEGVNMVETRGIPYLEVSALSCTNLELMYYNVLLEAYVRSKIVE